MSEKETQVIIESLVETITNLRTQNMILKYENERLKDSLKPQSEEGENNGKL